MGLDQGHAPQIKIRAGQKPNGGPEQGQNKVLHSGLDWTGPGSWVGPGPSEFSETQADQAEKATFSKPSKPLKQYLFNRGQAQCKWCLFSIQYECHFKQKHMKRHLFEVSSMTVQEVAILISAKQSYDCMFKVASDCVFKVAPTSSWERGGRTGAGPGPASSAARWDR